MLEAWWRREPTAFRVMRDRSGSVVGFHILAELDHLSHALLDIDPVARRCWDHLRRDPVPRGQRVLFNRCWMARDFGEAPSPVQAACWLDVKGRFMELRPDLRRIYSVVRDIATLGPMVAPLGFVALPGRAVRARRPALLRGRARLRPVIDRRLAVGADRRGAPGRRGRPILDVAEHQLVLDGRRVDLTAIEFALMSYLYQRPGQVVDRATLLREVWGTDYAGGSNVIEVHVGSLRRKLGDRSAAIETVRGTGLPVRALRLGPIPGTVRAGQATGQ